MRLCAERARVLWGGTADGITGVHEWVFSRTPTGVHVTTEESFVGDPVQSDVTGMQSALDGSLVAWLRHLKAAAVPRADCGQLNLEEHHCRQITS